MSRPQNKQSKGQPPDQAQRDLIVTELDRSLLVEAAAGTGKTTSLAERMIALLREGRCEIRTLAAVTFTRKAAAELRARFAVALERALRAEGDAKKRERLALALDQVDQCFIGTIHAFCGRLLRERPVEAGVDLSFEELDEDEDLRLRNEAFAALTRALLVHDPEDLLADLGALGLQLPELKDAFLTFAEYPDVDAWPAPDRALPDLQPTIAAVQRFAKRMRALAPRLPRAAHDDVGTTYLRVLRVLRGTEDLADPRQLMAVLERFDAKVKVDNEAWDETGDLCAEDGFVEANAWDAFRDEHAKPMLEAWAEHRYPTVMRALQAARAVYDRMRRDRGLLSFGDLLLGARDLLRDRPHVRAYFARRFSHLLVDEFQDTDPIQAEVLLLLAATDPQEQDWTRCRPRPGALFVVGDPKQSIYRFRRADIVTYGAVKSILEQEGKAVQLSANFRSTAPVVDWVNETFAPRFPDQATDQSPEYVALLLGRDGDSRARVDLEGVRALRLPADWSYQKELVIERDAGHVARFIRRALDAGLTVRRSERELQEDRSPAVTPGDFLIITPTRKQLARYASSLRSLGIPHQVTGSSALQEVDELSLLLACLRAALQPDNPVALVGALRSEAFGVSDTALYAYKKNGGRFYPGATVPEGLDPDDAAALGDALACLQRCVDWLDRLPPLAAIDRIVAELGLILLAATGPGHDVAAGSLAKAVELLRAAERQTWTAAQLVDYLEQLVSGDQSVDGISALGEQPDAVRLMNLHKAKGLEAPVVLLADPTGAYDHPVKVHVDRSGDRVTGYLRASAKRGRFLYVTLAQPAGWGAQAAREKAFLSAEALRLRYVAATRAGSLLVISQRAKYNNHNPWELFASPLFDQPSLPDPGPQQRPALPAVELQPEAVHAAGRDVADRLAACAAPTYQLTSAKPFALGQASAEPAAQPFWLQPGAGDPGADAQGEHGTEWGEVIHLLLQVAMQNPSADLVAMARSALAEHELDEALADQAVQLVSTVMASALWERARASERQLVEVPFSVLREAPDAAGRVLPTVVRGAIDLVFREADGWVVVDYKTDRVTGDDVSGLVTHYAPQVQLYAEAFTQCSGEPVKELGLYFTATGSYARLEESK